MGNILGNPFDDWVQTQIDVRQKSLGKYSNIPSKDLQYYTTKTPFIRLASSVNLTNLGEDSVLQKLLDLGIPESLLSEDKLAKNLILQGGVVNATETNNNLDFDGLKFGLNNGELFNGSYGWGGISERGYVPLPGITNADVTYYNNGALSKTVINIKCFSKAQFQLLDVLYLRPGYTLLLEFGWSQYLDNDGNLQSFNNFATPPMSDFLSPNKNGANVDQYSLYRTIEETRKQYNGNYEAIFGKVTNFSWQFNSDGSYDCQVQLTAVGDVIESLKINIASPTPNISISQPTEENNGESPPGETTSSPIVANQNNTLINKKLYEIYQSVSSILGDNSQPLEEFLPFTISNFRSDQDVKLLKFEKGLLYKTQITLDSEENNLGNNPQVYIKYGAFLAYLQSELSLYSKKNTPIFTFDINFDNLNEDENFIFTIPGQISTDPRICLIPFTNFNIGYDNEGRAIGYSNEIGELNKNLSQTKFSVDNNPYLARVVNIMININYVAEVLNQTPRDEDNNINLLNFLDSLNKGLIDATGNINEYAFKLDQSGLKIQFQEDIPQRFNQLKGNEEFSKFNVFGVQKEGIGGSFIRNINLRSELSNDFATLISIGAQSNGNQVNANATSFSNYNKGLVDRIIPDKASSSDLEQNTLNEDNTSKDIELANIIDNSRKLFESINFQRKYINIDISSFKSQINTALSLAFGILCESGEEGNQLQSPFFLPFNLELTMDGLSGMKLYEKFRITDNILPPSYNEDSIDIIIKGINHSIDTTAWTTKLDTLSTPRPKLAAVREGASKIIIKEKEKELPNLTFLGRDITFGPPPPPGPEITGASTFPLSPTRREAMLLSYNGVFGRDGQTPPNRGLCARWTWNLALNYINFLRGGKLQSPQEQSGGNARDPEFHKKLTGLGYQKFTVRGLTKNRLRTLLTDPVAIYGYGDVLVYYCNIKPPKGERDTHYKYGHAQIYVDNINSSGFATDKQTNYNSSFIYNSREGDNWNLIIFRAPHK